METNIIEKEQIAQLTFPKTPLVADNEHIEEVLNRLKRALSLGNDYKHKVKISFVDDKQTWTVETTVWALTEKNVVLKAGVTIPIQRIESVAIIGPIEK